MKTVSECWSVNVTVTREGNACPRARLPQPLKPEGPEHTPEYPLQVVPPGQQDLRRGVCPGCPPTLT